MSTPSLPLMGIGNYSRSPQWKARRGSSLPLMGIGNGVRIGESAARDARSLPLMGIGNDGTQQRERQHFPAHYPSWGLETHLGIGAPGDIFALITPHGDWKPSAAPSVNGTPSYSLPLMGIGNAGRGGHHHAARRPHYPSWGLETPVRRLFTRALRHSLPLMGIGNPCIQSFSSFR